MFSVEIRINQQLIAYLKGQRIKQLSDSTQNIYSYDLHELETGKIFSGKIQHNYNDGIKTLVATILTDVTSKKR